MKRILMNVGMLVVMAVAIGAMGSSASAQGRHGGNGNGNGNGNGRANVITQQRDWRANQTRGNRRFGLSHKKNAHGYRNYGQYRRTQVGNRRWSLTHRRHRRNTLRLTPRNR